MTDVLEEGDVMRFSFIVIEALQDTAGDVLMRVVKIERQPDGTVKLWLENADAPAAVNQ